MSKQIFVNLPVSDIAKATEFYEALGLVKIPMFSDEKASALAWSEEIVLMILKEEFYATFLENKEISDAKKTSEVLLCLSFDSKEEVQKFADKAKEMGANVYTSKNTQPSEWMFSLSVEDLDGHVWEAMWMDVSAFQK